MDDDKLEFSNELSTKILNEVTQMKDIVRQLDKNGKKVNVDPLDLKLFYIFDANDKDKSLALQTKQSIFRKAFSLREIQHEST